MVQFSIRVGSKCDQTPQKVTLEQRRCFVRPSLDYCATSVARLHFPQLLFLWPLHTTRTPKKHEMLGMNRSERCLGAIYLPCEALLICETTLTQGGKTISDPFNRNDTTKKCSANLFLDERKDSLCHSCAEACHRVPPNIKRCNSRHPDIHACPLMWPVMLQDRTMQSFFSLKHSAAASSFPICEMYIFNAGLCCSSAMALTQGQGFESHCGCPLWKYALSLCCNAI